MSLVEIEELAKNPKPEFINGQNLSSLSLQDLAIRYRDINSQSQLFKRMILLEARSRFNSNIEFGDWVQSVKALCLDGQPARTRYMNYARYFSNKDKAGISLTACYEISRPENADVADVVYEEVLKKNLSVAEVKQKIKMHKERLGSLLDVVTTRKRNFDHKKLNKCISKTLCSVSHLSLDEQLYVLRASIKALKKTKEEL